MASKKKTAPKKYPQLQGAVTAETDLAPTGREEEVQTFTSAGEPADRRITSIAAARSLCSSTEQAFEPDAIRRARLKGQIDGAPPYDQAKLDELCLGNMINENFLELSSILDHKASQWHEVFYEVPTVAEFSKAPGTPEPFDDYANILAEEFHALLMSWTGFLTLMDKVRREADAYGIGPAVFPDAWDWRPTAYSAGSFFFDPNAKLDPESIEYFILTDYDHSAGDLYRWAFTNEKQAEKEGWRLDAVKKLLISVYAEEKQQAGEDKKYPVSTWENTQQRIRNGDTTVEVKQFERVKLKNLYVKEVASGKISRYMFSETPISGDDDDDFLFVEEEAYDKIGDVLWFLPFNGGDGYLKSIRGLASKIEGHCDLSNRYLGQVYTAGFLSASVMLQPRNGGDYSNAPMIRAGAVTVLPPNFEVIQRSTMVPQVASLIPLRDLSMSIMRNNTGVWRENAEVMAERQATKTARQVAEESSKEARFEKAAVQFDYSYLERLYTEIWKRVTDPKYLSSGVKRPGQEEARTFIRRCVLRGLPQDLLPQLGDLFTLHATRAIGMGSWGLKLDITNQILNASNSFDERGRHNALRDWTAIRVGFPNVGRYVGPVNRDTLATDDSSHAVLENNDMSEGSQVMAASDQWHTTHIQVHSPILIGIIKAFNEQQIQDPRKMLQVLQVAMEHVHSHWQFIAGDPTRVDAANAAEQLLKEAAAVAKPLAQMVAKLQQLEEKQAEQEQQVVQEAQNTLQSRKDQLAAMEIQGEIENTRLKIESLNEMRREKTSEQHAINRERAAVELQLKAEKQAAEIELDRQKVAQKGQQ